MFVCVCVCVCRRRLSIDSQNESKNKQTLQMVKKQQQIQTKLSKREVQQFEKTKQNEIIASKNIERKSENEWKENSFTQQTLFIRH